MFFLVQTTPSEQAKQRPGEHLDTRLPARSATSGTSRFASPCLMLGATTPRPRLLQGEIAMTRKLKLTVAAVMTAVITTMGVSTATTGVAVAKDRSACC